jgi:hypothetical protein
MATMTKAAPSGDVVFEVPVRGRVPGQPLAGDPLVVLRTRGGRREAASLEVRIRTIPAAFMAKLPKLLATTGFPGGVFRLGRQAATGLPVLTFEAPASVLARIPAGIQDLAALEAFLSRNLALLDLRAYALTAIAFESDAPDPG